MTTTDARLCPSSTVGEIEDALRHAIEGDVYSLSRPAYQIKCREIGRVVHFRGIIELGNRCRRNCLYCGIRAGNRNVGRYMMSAAEIAEATRFASDAGYGAVVLQSGELTGARFTSFIENVVEHIRAGTPDGFGITLSLGEQSPETYRRWLNAGANRYLLRIETSNPALFARIHTGAQNFEARRKCLRVLRDLGYQVGTGVIIALPGQSFQDMARDIDFFREIDADMIGMGPYLPHRDTPMGRRTPPPDEQRREYLLNAGLAMIAATRLVMRDVNIAATTVMQALSPVGRELAILAGANVIMPNLTPVRYRASYQLYDDKPCVDEGAAQCRSCIDRRIRSIGEAVAVNEVGDPPHFTKRMGRHVPRPAAASTSILSSDASAPSETSAGTSTTPYIS
ncbi:[FeFe] hydrogenase H-cluster radical SAM maturase HydE [Myxococcota bacterium]|nr:[FeFe] hydrogenase H-cluster radical SAM maturase HydE [Myxococcota bacterium]